MAPLLEAVVEQWKGLHHSLERVRVANDADLGALLHAMQAAESASLTLETAAGLLIVGAAGGIYTVAAMLASGEAFDRLGVPHAAGTIPFLEGGQSIELPRRHALTLEQALVAAQEFLMSGIVIERGSWQAQA